MEALGGRGGIAPTHSRPRHSLGVSDQRYAPAALVSPGKGPPVPIVQEAGWAPEPVWTQRLEEKSFAPPGIEPRSPGRPARSQTLYCLSYPGSNLKMYLRKIVFVCLDYIYLLQNKVQLRAVRKTATNFPVP
jgi:hypothetical protein